MMKVRYLVTNCQRIDTTVKGITFVMWSKAVVGLVALMSFALGIASAQFGSGQPQTIHAVFAAGFPWIIWGGAWVAIICYCHYAPNFKAGIKDSHDTIGIRSFYFYTTVTLITFICLVPLRILIDVDYSPTVFSVSVEILLVIVICELANIFVVTVLVPLILEGVDEQTYLDIWGAEAPQPTSQTGQNTNASALSLVSEPDPEPRIITIRGNGLARDDLMYLEAQGNYVNVVTTDHNFMVKGPLGAVVDELQDMPGFQPHRSTWVPGHAFLRSQKKGADMSVTLKNGITVRVTKSRQKEIAAFLAGQAGQTT